MTHFRRRPRLSLWLTIILAVVGLQAVAVTAILVSSYFSSERVLLEHARHMIRDAAEETRLQTASFLEPAENVAVLTSRLIESGVLYGGDVRGLELYLFDQLVTRPEFAGLYLGLEDGGFIYVKRDTSRDGASFRTKIIRNADGARTVDLIFRDDAFREVERQATPDDPYDPRLRPWYTGVRERGGSAWTDPYIFYTSQRPGITASAPVTASDGSLVGVVGVDIELGDISSFLATWHDSGRGHAMIVNAYGEVIAHPRGTQIRATPENGGTQLRFAHVGEIADDSGQAAFAALGSDLDTLRPDSPRYLRYVADGEPHLAVFCRLGDQRWPWIVAVALPENQLLGQMRDNRKNNILMALAISLASVLVGLAVAQSVIRPLGALARQSERVARGEFPKAEPLKTPFFELNRTGLAFARMADWLRRYRQESEALTAKLEAASRDLSDRVDLRTAELCEANEKLRAEIAEREQAEHELEREVEQHRATAEALRYAVERATAASAAKSRFLSSVSHEVRTPLNAILGFSALMKSPDMAREKMHEFSDHIAEAGRQLLALVDQILDLSSIEAGKTTFELSAVDPREAVAVCIEQTRTLGQARDIEVIDRTDLPPGLCVTTDAGRLKQVLLNLTSNAVKYNRRGGQVVVLSKLLPGYLRIEVEDTGPGIATHRQHGVFEPFDRLGAEGGTTEGTGLGLSLAKDLIEKMGGAIGFRSVEGEGSVFWIDVPLATGEAAGLDAAE